MQPKPQHSAPAETAVGQEEANPVSQVEAAVVLGYPVLSSLTKGVRTPGQRWGEPFPQGPPSWSFATMAAPQAVPESLSCSWAAASQKP